jgi:hypothetical protein
MAKSRKPAKRKVGLAPFFRKLAKSPNLLEKFSSGEQGRTEVLGTFNLAARHRKMLAEGCIRDIISELAGVAPNSTVVVNSTDEVECGHAECEAFMNALKPR